MIIITLEGLFRYKQLCGIYLGMPANEVAKQFGHPSHWENERLPFLESEIWTYGNATTPYQSEIQFNFDFQKQTLSEIMCLFSSPQYVKVRDVDYSTVKTLNGMRLWLSTVSVPFRQTENRVGAPLLISDAGTCALFSQDSGHDAELEGIRASIRSPDVFPWSGK